jgi:hypothetical protein
VKNINPVITNITNTPISIFAFTFILPFNRIPITLK